MDLTPWQTELAAPRQPLNRQLLLSHLSVALVGVVMLFIALVSTYELRDRVRLLAEEGIPLAQASMQVLAGVHHSLASLRGWVSLGDPRFLDNWQAAWGKEIEPAVVLIQRCQHVLEQTCPPERLRELQVLLAKLQESQRQVRELTDNPNNESVALQRMAEETDPLAIRVITLVAAIAADARELLEQEADAARTASSSTVWNLVMLILVMLVVAYGMSYSRTRALVRPIMALAEATRQLAAGSLRDDIPLSDTHELGDLTASFNMMRVSMQQTQAELRRVNALLEKRVVERTAQLATTNNSLMQEIVVRNKTGEALRESEARMRAMTRAIPDLVFVVDEDGLYREILAAGRDLATIGTTPIRGKLLSEVHSPEMAEFFLNIIRRALQSQQIQVAEYELATASGTRWFESRTAPLDVRFVEQSPTTTLHPQGDLFGPPELRRFAAKAAAIVVARDITQRKQAEAQLRQAHKMEAIGQLTGGIAHDFNNLLAIIMGNLELLHEKLTGQPRLFEFAQQALKAAGRGANLTRRLLAFARRQPLLAQPTDLNKLILGMLDLVRRTLGVTIQIDTALAPDLEPTLVDTDQFETALLNLVINARDAMPQGGRLTLETANVVLDEDYAATQEDLRSGPYVMLVVSDTGIGMAPAILERVIEPFFTTKAPGKGSGLGLSMVYGLVKQSGGHLTIYSELGQGTSVRLYLPRIQAKVNPVAETLPAAAVPLGQGETILVVEDETDVRLFAVKALHALGYETLQAGDAETALGLLDAAPRIVLLFTDIVLPGSMDGVRLAAEARRRRPGLPVLFTSGYTEHALVGNGQLSEEVDLLTKPYRKADLGNKLRALLGRRGHE
ncbi:MAG: ATP-binding protein [Candidatus Competibacteraceae bacterium]|nr:ATP-binding protein [Candidatus Competibacteraceae bacterium]